MSIALKIIQSRFFIYLTWQKCSLHQLKAGRHLRLECKIHRSKATTD